MPTSQFPQCVVSFLINTVWYPGISKSQLSDRQRILVSQVSTVLPPCGFIGVTITIVSTCTAVGHSTSTFSTVDCCSTPVVHLGTLTWYPPTSFWVPRMVSKITMVTFVFFKLLTFPGPINNGNNLLHGNVICNLSSIRTWTFISVHECSWFTVMSNHRHASTILWRHVTVYLERWCKTESLGIHEIHATRGWRKIF